MRDIRQTAPLASAGDNGAKSIGRVEVSEPVSISSGIAQRYATAVFELAKEGKNLKAVESDVDALDAALTDSGEFRALIASPVYSRGEQGAAVTAIAKAMGLSATMASTLGLMAAKRRLFVLPQLIARLRAQIAEDKGEVTAEVTAAKAMTKAQQDKLAAALKASVGKDVKINLAVDESLIGGLVVKVGSKMIDSSIRSRLNALKNSMKEVG
jgi:F-type H+-transporting ATPase subunit delta